MIKMNLQVPSCNYFTISAVLFIKCEKHFKEYNCQCCAVSLPETAFNSPPHRHHFHLTYLDNFQSEIHQWKKFPPST